MSQLPLAQSAFADPLENPSAKIVKALTARPKQDWVGAALFFMAGIGLAIFFVISNTCALMDVFCGGIEINHRIVPSPLALFELTHMHMIVVYGVLSTMTILCGVAIAREDMPRMLSVMKLVPIILFIYLVGIAMRKSGPIGRYISYFYLIAGSMLAGLAIMYFIKTGMTLPNYETTPLLYSACLQGGLIIAISAALSLDN